MNLLDSTIEQQCPIDIDIPSASDTQPLMKLPCADLLGDRGIYNRQCVPLYKAANGGNWEAAKILLDSCPKLVRCSITKNHETALHIAVSTNYPKQQETFVKKLVGLMKKDDLQLQNGNGETALYVAAAAGHPQMAKVMVDEDEGLLTIPDREGKTPLSVAALFGNRDMVKYLYDSSKKMSGAFWTQEKRDYVFLKCIESDLFDIALQIVKDFPDLASSGNALRILARKPEAFRRSLPANSMVIISSGLREILNYAQKRFISPTNQASPALQLLRIIWQNILELNEDEIDDIIRGPPDPTKEGDENTTDNNQIQEDERSTTYSSQVLFVATENGNTIFVYELLCQFPDLIRKVNDNKQSIFHVAVSYRHKDIYSLLYGMGSITDSVITLEDENGNNMLHLVGERAKGDQLLEVPGVVQRMQQELSYVGLRYIFVSKLLEVKTILPPYFQEMKNKRGLTPRELFTKTHKDLVSEGEKWLKEVAAQLMVVATLVATVAFAAPFTLPGGLDEQTGSPIYRNKTLFVFFMIADDFSFIFSFLSIICLIFILTSRYAERDFLERLPRLLLASLGALYNALTTLMATFFFNFLLVNPNVVVRVYVSIVVFPLIFMLFLIQWPLFLDMGRSMRFIHNRIAVNRLFN